MPVVSVDDLDASEEIPGFVGRFLHGDNMTVTRWSVDAGASFPEHSHPHEQVSVVLDGEFALTIDGETRVLAPGQIAVIPPRAAHSGEARTDCEILDIFSPVREDYA